MKLYVFFLLILFSGFAVAQNLPADSAIVPFEGQISVDSRLTASTAAVGDTLQLRIILSWSGPSENFMFWQPDSIQAEKLAFSHIQTINRKKSTTAGYESSTTFNVYLVAEAPGRGLVEPMRIKYLSRGAKDFEYINVRGERLTIQPVPKKFPWGLLIKAMIGAGLLAGLGFGWYRVQRQRKLAAQTITRTPAQEAADAVDEAKTLRIKGETTEYHNRLSVIIKNLLIQTDRISGPVKSTNDFLREIDASEMDELLKEKIKTVLNTCEEIRFSGREPEPHETDMLEAKVKEIIKQLA